MASLTFSDTSFITSPSIDRKSKIATADIKKNFSNAFTSSMRPFVEKTRPKPLIGSSFSILKAIACGLNKSPPITAGPASAATTVTAKKGVKRLPADVMTLARWLGSSLGLVNSSPEGDSA